MDKTDKLLLNRIQSDFPVSSRPWAIIAEEFGLNEDEVIRRVRRLKSDGIIRRVGGNFVPGKLGYVSTLCAAKVPTEKISAFADAVNSYTGVTHNYVRENGYNVWFTFIAPSMETIEKNLKEITRKTGVMDIINLPATHVFKIKAHFTL